MAFRKSVQNLVIQITKKPVLPLLQVSTAHQPFQVRSKGMSSLVNGVQPRPFTIAVEGNIGSGKTTFINRFESEDGIEIVAEPVDRWRNVQGHNLLNMMYSDPKKNSLMFQTYVQLTMLQAHMQPATKPVRIMERSLLSARHCFIENLYQAGNMTEAEYVVITEWYNFLVSNPKFDANVNLIVYLRTDPEVAYERVLKRSRREENQMPLDYIKSLHNLHEDWLIKKTKFQPVLPQVLVIDANKDLSSLSSVYDEWKDKILNMSASL